MKQILHIFCKDVRHLWVRVFIVLLVMAAHAVFEVRTLPVNVPEMNRANTILMLLNVLLPLGIWFLIAWLVFQETLPGDRQFWLTRPYSRLRLLISKVLFILIFINVPLFVSDCCILAAQGFPVAGVLPQLLLRQGLLTALFVMPAFALASLSNGVSQFLLGWFILLIVPVLEIMLVSLSTKGSAIAINSGSTFIAVLAVTTCAIVLWQYASRRAVAARLFLLGVTTLFLPAIWGIPMLAHSGSIAPERGTSTNEPGVQIAYDRLRYARNPSGGYNRLQGFVSARIPLTVAGLAPETLLRGSGRVVFNLRGAVWPQHGGFMVGTVERLDDEYWQTMDLPISDLKLLEREPVSLHSSFDLEIVTDAVETRLPARQQSVSVPGVGLCHIFQNDVETQITCRAGLGPSREVTLRLEGSEPPGFTTTLVEHSVSWELSPTTDVGGQSFSPVPPQAEFAFIPRRKLAELHRTLELDNVRMTDYILPH